MDTNAKLIAVNAFWIFVNVSACTLWGVKGFYLGVVIQSIPLTMAGLNLAKRIMERSNP